MMPHSALGSLPWKKVLGLSVALLACAASVSAQAQTPRRIPRQTGEPTAALQGVVRDPAGRRLGGVVVCLRRAEPKRVQAANTDAEGVFRIGEVPPGTYDVRFTREGYVAAARTGVSLAASSTLVLEVTLDPQPVPPSTAPAATRRPEDLTGPPQQPPLPSAELESPRRSDATAPVEALLPTLPPAEKVFEAAPDRWAIAEPEYTRYAEPGPYPPAKGNWWDPFNRNRLKGDYPLFGRTFLNLQLTSDTLVEGRRLPVPSNASAAQPGSEEFFGRGEQLFTTQTFRLTADVFRGDTAFRPFDWRLRVTPVISINYLNTRENAIVNVDVRKGTNRFDTHAGLQEAFLEAKLLDLSPNYDFLSLRAGIQPFSSDFRGFVFVDEQPGVRLFGNLASNRLEYNVAYFYLLEKDTNSTLNTFQARDQQVLAANLYVQDFLVRGYTTQFSVLYNKDDGRMHFDDNGFLVRPAPVGAVTTRNIRAAYVGWTGNGHVGRLNVSHAFYQALGRDDLNPLAGRRVTINAQMAAAELSLDRDWLRFKGSFFYASGDADPRDDRARGFDSIVDSPVFAGGTFSLWNRQSIRLTGTGVALVGPNSLLPSLRPNKEEGKANFVNPGLFLFNAGTDIELTPKLRAVVNVNFLRFDRTEPLELLLFQAPIRHTIGVDYSLGVQYRPPLSENMVLTFGGAALSPGQGFADIYTRKTLFSVFTNLRLQF